MFYTIQFDDSGTPMMRSAWRSRDEAPNPLPAGEYEVPPGQYEAWQACRVVSGNVALSEENRQTLRVREAQARLAAWRHAIETGGVDVQLGAVSARVATDRASQSQIASANVMAAGGLWQDGTPWKMADGRFVPLNAAQVKVLATRVGLYVATCFAREADLSAQIASNPDANITTGWPS